MQGEPNYSGQIAYEIDKEVQRIIKEQYERCKQILLDHEKELKLIAKTLLTEETLVAEQIRSLFYDGVLPEVDYDAARVVKDEDSDYSEGKYGKSYDDIREEQLEEGKEDMREDRKEDNDMNRERRHRQRDDRDNQTGHDHYVTVQMETMINIVDIQIMKKTQVMNNLQILTNHIIQTINNPSNR